MGSESTSQLVLSEGGSHCVSRPVSVETTCYQMMGSSSVESTGSPSIHTLRSSRRKSPSASSTVPPLRVMNHHSSLVPSVHRKHCPIHSSHCQEELSLQMTAPFKLPVSLGLVYFSGSLITTTTISTIISVCTTSPASSSMNVMFTSLSLQTWSYIERYESCFIGA